MSRFVVALLCMLVVHAAAQTCPTGSAPGPVSCAFGATAPTAAAMTALNAGRMAPFTAPVVTTWASGSLCALIAYPCNATTNVAAASLNVLNSTVCQGGTIYLSNVVGWSTCASDLASYAAIPGATVTVCSTGTGCNQQAGTPGMASAAAGKAVALAGALVAAALAAAML